MAASIEQFVKRVADSGLVVGRVLDEVRQRFGTQSDAHNAVQWLVKQKKLTRYQAAVLYHGRGPLVLGNYLLEESLGKGGMGQVFVARHLKLDRTDAIKVLPPEMSLSESAVNRFRREAQTSAKVEHPNIVKAYDVDQADGIHFLVMEYVPGEDLEALTRRQGQLSVEEAVSYIRQAAAGLGHAHELGIVHRDIKPANLLVSVDGVVKVLDLGLARVLSRDADSSVCGLTQVGQLMGTVEYMAPEQADDIKNANVPADVYSLGCTMFRVLAGRIPYSANSMIDILLAHRTAPIPTLTTCRSDVPAELDWLCQRMMAKEPVDRPQTMEEVIRHLTGLHIAAPKSSSVILASQQDDDLKDFLKGVTFEDEEDDTETPDSDMRRGTGVRASWLPGTAVVVAVTLLIAVVVWLSKPKANVAAKQNTVGKMPDPRSKKLLAITTQLNKPIVMSRGGC